MMRKIKVVHLITRLDSIGGAQIHVLDLARYWIRTGADIQIWGGCTPANQFVKIGCKIVVIPHLVRDLNLIKDIRALYALLEKLFQQRPDILILHSSKAGVLGRLAAHIAGIPVVFTAHGWSFAPGVPQPRRFFSWLFEFLAAQWEDKIITVSYFDRALGLKFGVGNPQSTLAIHNGVEDISAKYLAAECSEISLIMVARHSPQKDYATLLSALVGLEVRFNVKLVGDGPLIGETIERIDRLGLGHIIEVLGARSDVAELLSKASIMVLATNWEGLPRSIIEGLRAGLPIVATDVGGNSELVIQGHNGFLVPRGDVTALRASLRQLMISPETRISMGKNSRQMFKSQFRCELLFDRTIRTVESVVKFEGKIKSCTV
jgi:glycosyltransferase involved in cell wall biosynthesis